jgi:hypothetical protein
MGDALRELQEAQRAPERTVILDPTTAFVLGIVFGVVVLLAVIFFERLQYREILLMCAQQGTSEKLPDGNFYRIVPEDEIEEWKRELRDVWRELV